MEKTIRIEELMKFNAGGRELVGWILSGYSAVLGLFGFAEKGLTIGITLITSNFL